MLSWQTCLGFLPSLFHEQKSLCSMMVRLTMMLVDNIPFRTIWFCDCVRCALDAEIMKYVGEAYPKGVCSVYCARGKDVEEPGSDFELVVVISAARHSPQNFW